MTDGNTYAINKQLDDQEDYDALQEVTVELEQAETRIEELEAKLEKAEKIIAAAKEMYETAMLTGGGSPEAWVNHVRARNAFASTLAELKGQDDD